MKVRRIFVVFMKLFQLHWLEKQASLGCAINTTYFTTMIWSQKLTAWGDNANNKDKISIATWATKAVRKKLCRALASNWLWWYTRVTRYITYRTVAWWPKVQQWGATLDGLQRLACLVKGYPKSTPISYLYIQWTARSAACRTQTNKCT